MAVTNSSDRGLPQIRDELRVICVAKHWEHHTASGGYDQLARAVCAEVVRRRLRRRTTLYRIERRLWRELWHPKSYVFDYRYEDWLAELGALQRSWWHAPDVVHVLYGDEQLDLLLRHRRLLSCPLIATFHLPPYVVRERFEKAQKHLLSGIDAAVVVARNQLQAFGSWLGQDRVIYVPHGIDTDRFCPGERPPRQECVRLITVGGHMRDWRALDEIIAQCVAQRLPVRFDIVTANHGLSSSANHANIHFHRGIPEEQLIGLYRAADALLVPVLDATANNAILEALACGTPAISTMVGGIPDYADNKSCWLFEKGEVSQIVKLIGEICDEPDIAFSRRSAARSRALIFSWNRVAKCAPFTRWRRIIEV
jgi:glycosyltransferase involved in cell wall biosynthesis